MAAAKIPEKRSTVPSDTGQPPEPESFINPANREILESMFKPLTKWLEHPEVEEIQVNRPGEIIQRLRKPLSNGSLYAYHLDSELSVEYLTQLAYIFANVLDMADFGPQGIPVVYGQTPGGHRIVIAIGPNVQFAQSETWETGSIAIVMRQFIKDQNNSLGRWGITMGAEIPKSVKSVLKKDADPNNPHAKIFNSIARGDHLLISGETGSGKTSLLRALAEQIDPNLRVVTIEDVRELVIPQRNRCHLLMQRSGASNQFNYKAVVDLIVRMTPDIVMAGEISTTNAGAVWELMRSGHGHFMSTIHADDPDEAISTFMTRIAHTHPEEVRDRDSARKQMHERLRVIQLKRVGEKRRVTAIK